ncbi:MAG: metallophosphoesterase [Methylotenera sp.]
MHPSFTYHLKRKPSFSTLFYALIAFAFLWTVMIEPRWVAQREMSFKLTKTSELKGLKIVLSSDWHLTKHPLWRVMTINRAREIVKEINASQPDIIILAGDFIADQDYHPEIADTAEEEIAMVLGELKAKHGVYATLGNHDWWFDGVKFTQALRRHHITVLENESIKLENLNLWLAGIGDETTAHAMSDDALKNIPSDASVIVTVHDPGSLLKVSESWQNPNALFLAGHTHGGQVYLPWYGAPVVPSAAPREWAYGWVQHNHHNMYVTSGLGVSILPVRFNMRPEWVQFNLE